MTKTKALVIRILAVANILVYAAAAWLLWYIWPVLVEPSFPAVPTSSFVVPVSAPSEEPENGASLADADFPPPLPRVTPAAPAPAVPVPSGTSPAVATALPTSTPQTLVWPSKQLDGQGNSAVGGWGAPTPVPAVRLSPQQVNVLIMGADYKTGK